jgi:hypothetical protein
MTLENFNKTIQDLDQKGLFHDSDFVINKDLIDTFKENEERFLNEFFESLESDIKNLKFSDISNTLPILSFDPIKSKDYQRFNNIIFSAADKLKDNLNHSDFEKLGWFIWVLLDHTLHEWTISDKDSFYTRLRKIKLDLVPFEKIHEEKVQLLYQKMGHFGVE